ncbi:OsmC family protein [Fodinibius halophilus]|uniref:OsmC family peroxiredoxin n=1 Tax=Fodinibius halophilus TaxID=1736908 RepID=A0A6M1TF43_9BACT|nr:OsmC family protein [Fodinibius halophilus]NGP88792.1 OsmC family peroxiredoxin [Fodinibius halophilus]
MSEAEHKYEVDLSWKKDRIGTLRSNELEQEIEVATPPQFPGGVEGIWSPEHLFTSSVSSCFMTTFIAIAEYSKLEFKELDVNATAKVGKVDGKFEVTEIILRPQLVIADEKRSDKALRILEKAEKACLISRSVSTEILLNPDIQVIA